MWFLLQMTFGLSNCSPRTYNLYWCHRAVWFSRHWPAPGPAACRPSPCPARPAGMKAAPGGRSLWVTLWRKRWAFPPSWAQENYCCRDSCLVYTAANFLCSFKPNCCQREEPLSLSDCPALFCLLPWTHTYLISFTNARLTEWDTLYHCFTIISLSRRKT